MITLCKLPKFLHYWENMSYFLDLKNKKGYTIYDVKSSDYFDLTSVLLSPFFCSTHSFYFIFAALFKCCIFFAVLRLDNLHLKWYNIIVGRQCRYSIAVITPVSQTGDAGSTPVICSTKAPVFTGAFLFCVNSRVNYQGVEIVVNAFIDKFPLIGECVLIDGFQDRGS